ncbi:hypothetical protein NliqN6_5050 [Naganishia liquefaciens]|uniref:DUF962 domain-containing protein n=1 Tax=Naganishia liquefaciens TaxID=104408 RepID=A0A8H3TX10_9TREE|nr:hypothetical protein NliqN6_5050 [Naganishia liquefaciens]
MSELLQKKDMQHESLEEEERRLGPDRSPVPDWLNVKKQLTFYASYHSHPINIAIHMICIPIILWSTLLFLAHIPLGENATITRLAPWLSFQPNAALVMNACYVAYYFALEPFGALTYLPHALLSQLTVTYLATTPAAVHPFHLSSLRIASYAQLFGWLSQFAGHGFAEGRAPALLDNLLQALVLAPFFSHLEYLFLAFKYNPKLQAEIKRGVQADKEARRLKKGKKAM